MGRKKRAKAQADIVNEIKRMLLTGTGTRDIECRFEISIKGIKYHITEIYKEEGVKNRHEFMAKYVNMPEKLESPEKYGQLPLVPFKMKRQKKMKPKEVILKEMEKATSIHLPLGRIG